MIDKLRGTGVALVTPFLDDESIDFDLAILYVLFAISDNIIPVICGDFLQLYIYL